MVDSLAPGVARGWRGFRHGGGYRGGKRGPSTLVEKGPGRSGAGEGGRGPKGADLTRWRGSDRACCRSWTTQVEIHYSLLFAAVTILVFSLPFPLLLSLSPSLSFSAPSIRVSPRDSFAPRSRIVSSLFSRFFVSLLLFFSFRFFSSLPFSPLLSLLPPPPSLVSPFLFRALARRVEPAQAVTSDEHPTTGKSGEVRHARFG